MKINIKGIIVPSQFDTEIFNEEINKGIIAPLSHVQAQIDNASKDEPLEVYINSPGGSVFAGHEMLNAIVNWRTQNNQQVTVTVGAMAASAASTIATMLGPVKAHANAMFMFHGASSVAMGGKEAFLDQSDLLEKINRQVITTLISKYNMDIETVGEWFSEGRMGWLDANEAKEVGLVSEVIDNDANVIEFASKEIEQLGQRGLNVAAMLEIDTKKGVKTMELQDVMLMLQLDPETAQAEDVQEALDALVEKNATSCDEAYDEGFNAGKSEKLTAEKSEISEKFNAELSQVKEELENVKQEKTKTDNELRNVKKELEKAEQRISKLDKGFNLGEDADEATSKDAYWNIVNSLIEEGYSQSQAILKTNKENPELFQALTKGA